MIWLKSCWKIRGAVGEPLGGGLLCVPCLSRDCARLGSSLLGTYLTVCEKADPAQASDASVMKCSAAQPRSRCSPQSPTLRQTHGCHPQGSVQGMAPCVLS